eukprot:TRINITY_DN3929_c0_g2_i1.p1 TRINITY_DN3929_c0_g2~~TRINITY_DN3929_c0_g2_i1.p1  ORF type:complete len:384 (+),score=40.50 TRINITY_DN3929_c0_g2_i1:192-1343(+)
MQPRRSALRFLVNRHRYRSPHRMRTTFSRSIHNSSSIQSLIFRDIPPTATPEPNYPPPTHELLKLPKTITTADVYTMIAHFRKLGQLRPTSASNLIDQAYKLLRPRPALGEIQATADSKLTIVGNLHGQFFDLLQIFDLNGFPSPQNRYLFNGGYFGRGWFGSEILFTLFAFELAQPGSIFFNASNHLGPHADRDQRDLRDELKWKYAAGDAENESCYSALSNTLLQFSLAHVVQKSIFVAHGGAPCAPAASRVYDLNFLRSALSKSYRMFDSPLFKGEEELEADGIKKILLTGSPAPLDGQVESFLKTSNLKHIIRSNEGHINGISKSTDGKIWSLSSAPRGHNTRGAFIRFDNATDDGEVVYFNNAFDPYYDSNLKLKPYF